MEEQWNPESIKDGTQDPYKTLFVGNLVLLLVNGFVGLSNDG
jgi:hypothetical protein